MNAEKTPSFCKTSTGPFSRLENPAIQETGEQKNTGCRSGIHSFTEQTDRWTGSFTVPGWLQRTIEAGGEQTHDEKQRRRQRDGLAHNFQEKLPPFSFEKMGARNNSEERW